MNFVNLDEGIGKAVTAILALTLIAGSAAALDLQNGFESSGDLRPGSTVSNQKVVFNATGVSADGKHGYVLRQDRQRSQPQSVG
ncbi:MAG: hypothetical protein ABEJ99_00130 [Candidatus Nanohaloarchaea archaeon]